MSVPASGSVFPPGVTIVTATATDCSGNTASCNFTVTVSDTTPPNLTISAARTLLWLPLNGLVDVGLTVTATDNCDTDVDTFVTIYSDEAAGALTPDADLIGVAPAQKLRLRAEREPVVNSGRFYIVVVDAVDDSGNRRRECLNVVMPYNLTTSAILTWRALVPPLLPAIPCPVAASAPTVGPVAPGGTFTLLPITPFN